MNAYFLDIHQGVELPGHEICIYSSLIDTAKQFVPNLFFNLQHMRDPVPSSTLDIFHHFHLAIPVLSLMVCLHFPMFNTIDIAPFLLFTACLNILFCKAFAHFLTGLLAFSC